MMVSILCMLLTPFTVKGDTLFIESPQIVVIDDDVEVIKPSWEIIHNPKPKIHTDTLKIDWWEPWQPVDSIQLWQFREGKSNIKLM